MPTNLLVSMLRKGQTGDEILTILDMITTDHDHEDEEISNTNEPTLEEIAFWLVLLIIQGVDKLSPIL